MDGSRTVNPHIETNHYPLPLIDELLLGKENARYFCSLDLKGAYQQLIVSEETKKMLVINTMKGLYAYKRLPFGVKPAASIFQSVMDKILEGLNDVAVFIDDILIWAESVEALSEKCNDLLRRLDKFNVKINLEKCKWFVEKLTYLGHELSYDGISINSEKLKAIVESPKPQNVTQLKSFLGMIMFY